MQIVNEEWWFHEQFRAIERMGSRALFAFAALNVGGYARPLEAIVLRARPVPGYLDNEEITKIAEQIDAAEDAVLTDWLALGQWKPPAWFRREALRVMLVITGLPLNPLAHPVFAFRHATGIFPELQTRGMAKKIITAAFAKELQTFLDDAYTAHPFVGRDRVRVRRVYRNYQWAAGVILNKETITAIAKAEGMEHQSVNEAVHKIAAQIGVPLDLHAGRPPGQGNR